MLSLKHLRKKETKSEQFFALNIGDEAVRGAVWTVEEGKTQMVKLGGGEVWDGKDKDGLLKAADRTLSQASEGLKPEPTRVILGLPDSWVDKDAINAEKKTLIKHLCTELELKPLGFVTTDSAISAYLKVEEGTPLSAILIQLSSGEINLTLVKLGKTSGSQLVGRSSDLGADVEEGLSRFDQIDSLPARMILYNGEKDFEEDKQQLLSYDWEDKLPFIHFPKVEALNSEITIKAVALAGGSEVARSLGIEIELKEEKVVDASSLGFVAGKDAAEAGVEKAETVAAAAETEGPQSETPKVAMPRIDLTALAAKIKKIKFKLPELPAGRLPLLIGGTVTALFLLLFSLYWLLPKAAVTLIFEPEKIEQELEINLDAEAAAVDSDNRILPAELLSRSVSGEREKPASGTKTIGDPATGAVTIYNKTSSSKTFAAGTVLLGPSQLAFTLDEETTVASRSAEEDSEGVITITPGKAEAKIAAVNIGPESNLAADTRLSFKQFSEDDYYARTSGLAGGTAREVKAVTETDRESLKAELTAELLDTAKTELKQNLGEDEVLIEIGGETSLSQANFSHAAEEAADTLTLAGELDYQGAVYSQAALNRLLEEAIKTRVPENFIISGFSDIRVGEVEKVDEQRLKLVISYQAALLPRLDQTEIKQKIKGKYPEKIESYLLALPQFVKADIRLIPNLPQPFNTLPRLTKNINLEVKIDQ